MKKIGVLISLLVLTSAMAIAQKYAFVDSEYIRKNIPAFTTAQEQLDKLSTQWEKEVADGYAVVEQMYKSYQNECGSSFAGYENQKGRGHYCQRKRDERSSK